jgi:hypothetical protein
MAVTGLMLLGIPLAGEPTEGETGGTAGSEIFVTAGGSGEYTWLEIHGFAFLEDGNKIEDHFNVTVCEFVKWDTDKGRHRASGKVYGYLDDVYWADDPPQVIEITMQDFNEKSDNSINLTVHVLAQYEQTGPHGDEHREAFTDIEIKRPNKAPFAVALITDSDEDENVNESGWKDFSENDELTYYISATGQNIKFYLDATQSYDPDESDNVTEWLWDLDGDDQFGKDPAEKKNETYKYLGEGDHIIALMVSDDREDDEKVSHIVEIKIIVRTPIRYPDLTVDDISFVNLNGEDEIRKDDRAKITAHVKNIGDNKTSEDFEVYFEYRFVDTKDGVYEEMGRVVVTQTLDVNGLQLVDIDWDTGSADFLPGNYTFRATVDPDEQMKELQELNNVFETSNVTLLQKEGDEGDPVISIKSIEQSATDIHVNQFAYFNVTLLNTGEGAARYVDIHYFIDDVFQYFLTIDNLPKTNGEETVSFVFSGDVNGTFRVHFEVKDDQELIPNGESDKYVVSVTGGGGGGDIPDDPNIEKEDEGDDLIVYIIVGVVIAAGLGGAGVFFMKKKDEDVW